MQATNVAADMEPPPTPPSAPASPNDARLGRDPRAANAVPTRDGVGFCLGCACMVCGLLARARRGAVEFGPDGESVYTRA